MVLSVVGLVVAVIATALSVDLGMLAQEKRFDQKAADLAALDSVRGLNDSFVAGLLRPDLTVLTPRRDRVKTLADESAGRNGFDPNDTADGHGLTVDLGIYNTTAPDNFVPTCPVIAPCATDASADAVKVTITSIARSSFIHGSRTLTVTAVAQQAETPPPPPPTPTTVPPTSVPPTTLPPGPETASFSIGSSLVNLNTSSATLLNPIIGQMLGSNINLSLASWQGLAAGGVTLGALRTELAALGFNVGTADELLDANLTLAKLYEATANALERGGDTARANLFDVLKLAAHTTAQVELRDLIKVGAGTSDANVLGTSLNLFQLVTGSAEVANGTNFVSIPSVGIAVPGVSSTTLSLKVTELPQIYIGPVGGSVTTGQVELTVTTNLNLDVNVGGLLSVVRVTGALPVGLELAGAKGTLSDIDCVAPKGIIVSADPKAFSGAARVTTLRASTLLNLPLLDIRTTSATPAVDGPAVSLSFAHPSQFSPPPFSKHAGSQPVGLQSLTSVTAGTVTVLGILPLGNTAGQVAAAVMNALHPVIGSVDSNILTPLFAALGLDVGGADVSALGLDCPVAPPVTTTTTVATTVPPVTTTTTVLAPPAGQPKLVD